MSRILKLYSNFEGDDMYQIQYYNPTKVDTISSNQLLKGLMGNYLN